MREKKRRMKRDQYKICLKGEDKDEREKYMKEERKKWMKKERKKWIKNEQKQDHLLKLVFRLPVQIHRERQSWDWAFILQCLAQKAMVRIAMLPSSVRTCTDLKCRYKSVQFSVHMYMNTTNIKVIVLMLAYTLMLNKDVLDIFRR